MPTDLAALAHRRWLFGTVLAVLTIAAATGLCILEHPQLEPDDFRFLVTLQELAAGRISPWQAGVLENRWDHLWWIATTDVVRFFRPTLIASYHVDVAWFGGDVATLLRTNLVLHGAVCVLATVLAFRIIRVPLAAAAASLLYAALACHAETMWYVAGRNETLAAIGFLGALLLHGSNAAAARWLALPCFLWALLSKEVTLALPVVCLAYDVLVRGRYATWRAAIVADRWLWLGYAAVIGVVAVLRSIALPDGSNLVFPYFVAPWHHGFAAHVFAGLRNYAENLGLAQLTLPFLQPVQYPAFTSVLGTLVVFAGVAVLAAGLWREPRARWAGLFALVTWLPVTVVYISERYLVLPAIGLSLAVGLLLARARDVRRLLLLAVVAAWAAHQAHWLYEKNREISHRPQRNCSALFGHLQPVQAQLRAAKTIYFVDFPARDPFHAQFAAAQTRVMLDRLDVPVHVLTTFPMQTGRTGELQIRRVTADTIELAAATELVPVDVLFPMTPQQPGTTIDRPRAGAKIAIVAADGGRATRLRCQLPRPLAECAIVRWLPPAPIPPGTAPGPAHQARFVIVNP